MRYYQLDLAAIIAGDFDPRCADAAKLWHLVHHLPPDCALARDRDPHLGEWTQADELLAGAIEQLAQRLDVLAMIAVANLNKWAKNPPRAELPPRFEIERPQWLLDRRDATPPKAREMSPMADVAAFLKGRGVRVRVTPAQSTDQGDTRPT